MGFIPERGWFVSTNSIHISAPIYWNLLWFFVFDFCTLSIMNRVQLPPVGEQRSQFVRGGFLCGVNIVDEEQLACKVLWAVGMKRRKRRAHIAQVGSKLIRYPG